MNGQRSVEPVFLADRVDIGLGCCLTGDGGCDVTAETNQTKGDDRDGNGPTYQNILDRVIARRAGRIKLPEADPQGQVSPRINAIGTLVFLSSITLIVLAQLLLRNPSASNDRKVT